MIHKKSLLISGLFVLTALLAAGVYYIVDNMGYKYTSVQPVVSFSSREEQELYEFIERNHTAKNQGILTNHLDKPAEGDLPAGRDVLSESLGLMFQYALDADNRILFEKQYLFLKEVFIVKDNIVLWRVSEDNKVISTSNALVDDLRIAEALISAYERWGEKKYLKEALAIAKSMHKYNLNSLIPVNYYDFKAKKAGSSICTRYLDLEAIRRISLYDKSWEDTYRQAEWILRGSAVSDEGVFFYEEYDVGTRSFMKLDTVNTINQLSQTENMLKAGMNVDKTLDWLEKSFKWYGFVVNDYDVVTKNPSSKNESPAVYAYCTRIFLMAGNKEMAEKSYKRMLSMRVADESSKFFGGYAYVSTGESFSFNNLQALLALRYRSSHGIDKSLVLQ